VTNIAYHINPISVIQFITERYRILIITEISDVELFDFPVDNYCV